MIVPAILTSDRDEFIKMLDICSRFTNFAQIDIMDGKFVPSSSIGIDVISSIKFPLESEAHLMVEDPLRWVDSFKRFGARRIIFHYEIEGDKIGIIKAIKEKNIAVGVALNPDTPFESIEGIVNEVDSILFMSVVPGFYGSPFIPRVLEKITMFRKKYPHKEIGIDGGVKLDNVKGVKKSGVDYICVGSAILKQPSPELAYKKFKEAVGE